MPRKTVKPGTSRAEEQVRRSKEIVLRVTFQLLMETGLSGVSVDEVSSRSGVAKTTIYRHWPSRAALLLDACSKLGAKFDAPDTGSLAGDMMEVASAILGRLRSNNFSSVVPSIIDAAERDSQFAELYSNIHAETLAPLVAVIEEAKRREELPSNCVPSELVASVLGPLFYRRWFSREPLDERYVEGVVTRAIAGAK
jgi:AcrR family transcriptional regulator